MIRTGTAFLYKDSLHVFATPSVFFRNKRISIINVSFHIYGITSEIKSITIETKFAAKPYPINLDKLKIKETFPQWK